jgi:hypothetical protein
MPVADTKYPVGNRVKITATFTDSAGVLFAPGAIKFDIIEPDGTTTTHTSPHALIANPSTGVYTLNLENLTAAGRWTIVAYSDVTHIVKDEIRIIATAVPSNP